MQRKKSNKFDNTGIGFFIGFTFPVIVFFLVYLFSGNEANLEEFARSLWQLKALIKLLSLCVFVNSAVFMGFIRLKYEKTARGILGATIVYAFAVLISKSF